jgi:hypothetical protein
MSYKIRAIEELPGTDAQQTILNLNCQHSIVKAIRLLLLYQTIVLL